MKSLSDIIKNLDEEEIKSYFSEDEFYPKMHELPNREEELNARRREAMQIIQDAEQQASTMIQKFKEEGLRKGIEEVKPLENVLKGLIENVGKVPQVAIKELEPVVVSLAVALARKIIKVEITQNLEIIKQTVSEALAVLIDKQDITIQVNSEDVAMLESYRPELMQRFHDISNLRIEVKDNIVPGGCYIKTNRGDVDATIHTQFQNVAASFGRDVSF